MWKRVLWSFSVGLVITGCGSSKNMSNLCSNRVTPDPYQGVGYLDNGQALCTATLISPHVVLTAGHCAYGRNPGDVKFTLSPTPNSDSTPLYATASQIIMHPYYNAKDEGNPGVDVAIIQLANAGYEYGVSGFLPLGADTSLQQQSLLTTVGYGINNDGSFAIKRPKQVRFTNLAANPVATGSVSNGLVRVSRGPQGEIGCSGDSGSPLLGPGPDGAFTILGVYSTSESQQSYDENTDCSSGIQTGDYVAIDTFKPWVVQLQNQLESSADQNSCQ